MQGEYPIPSETETLKRWREATGRHHPGAPVALECTVRVGRCTITQRGERFKGGAEIKALLTGKRRKLKPRALANPVKFATFARFPGYTMRDPLAAQRVAYERAMETGEWAA